LSVATQPPEKYREKYREVSVFTTLERRCKSSA
jgi:hypothetical protein